MASWNKYVELTFTDESVYKLNIHYVAQDYADECMRYSDCRKDSHEFDCNWDRFYNEMLKDDVKILDWVKNNMYIEDFSDYMILISQKSPSRILLDVKINKL